MTRPALIVFLCGTYSDLSTERAAVLKAVRKLQLQHDSMEFFGARAAQPIETCLEEVRRSDLLVVIVGFKYGSLIPERTISFTEAEYSEGYRLGKPCLVYLRDENVPILPAHMERDPAKLEALERFKATLKERHTVAPFQDANDLAVSVAADLGRTVQALEEAASAKGEQEKEPHPPIFEHISSMIRDALAENVSEDSLLYAIDRAIVDVTRAVNRQVRSVFLSYSAQDKHIVTLIAQGLKSQGIRIWFDQGEIKVGASIGNTISQALDSVSFLVFFVSTNSIKSSWAQFELSTIISRRVSEPNGPIILPVVLDDTEIPPLLRDVKYIDLRDLDIGRGGAEISRAIKSHRKRVERIRGFQI